MWVKTFLLNNDFTNKIIIPFWTHEWTRLWKSESDIRKYTPDSNVKNWISFYWSEVFNVNTELTNWIDNLK